MSQNEKIREILESRRGDWVSMPTLAEAGNCFAVHSRISDLRKDGLEIENKVVRGPEGEAKSYYRIPNPEGTLELF